MPTPIDREGLMRDCDVVIAFYKGSFPNTVADFNIKIATALKTLLEAQQVPKNVKGDVEMVLDSLAKVEAANAFERGVFVIAKFVESLTPKGSHE